MESLAAYTTLSTCVASLLAGFATPFARACERRSIVKFIAFVAAYTSVLMLPLALNWRIGEYNWIGKALGISFSLAMVRLFDLTSDETGLKLPATSQAWWVSGLGIAVASCFIGGVETLIGPSSQPDAQDFIFQAFVPGIDEELALRGVGTALLVRAFSVSSSDQRAQWLALLVISFWFTAVHAVTLESGHLQILWLPAAFVLPIALLLGFVRLRSASLLGCVLAHNAANTTGKVLAWFGI